MTNIKNTTKVAIVAKNGRYFLTTCKEVINPTNERNHYDFGASLQPKFFDVLCLGGKILLGREIERIALVLAKTGTVGYETLRSASGDEFKVDLNSLKKTPFGYVVNTVNEIENFIYPSPEGNEPALQWFDETIAKLNSDTNNLTHNLVDDSGNIEIRVSRCPAYVDGKFNNMAYVMDMDLSLLSAGEDSPATETSVVFSGSTLKEFADFIYSMEPVDQHHPSFNKNSDNRRMVLRMPERKVF